MLAIDLSADVGEGATGDAALIPLMSSVNVACGGHAGDEATMARTVELARAAGAVVGAHPGYPDREGFGRRALPIPASELEASLVEQIRLLGRVAAGLGVAVAHVKPHGALYNAAVNDAALAGLVARAVRAAAPGAALVGLAGSALVEAGRAAGIPVLAEAFADRAYEPDGRLRSRSLPGALLDEPVAAAAQALSIARDGLVRALDGSWVPVRADTLCLHGDTPAAPALARAVRSALEAAGVVISAAAVGR